MKVRCGRGDIKDLAFGCRKSILVSYYMLSAYFMNNRVNDFLLEKGIKKI